MSQIISSEGNPAMNSHGTNETEGPEKRALTQNKANEQIKSAPHETDLFWFVHGMTTASHPNYYPKADINAS